jgi:hypothetical protein
MNLNDYLVPFKKESLLREYDHGKATGEYCHIPIMKESFSWKKAFQMCITSWPNFGKSHMALFLALVMAVKEGWKIALWSPEELSSELVGDKVEVNANDIHDNLVYMLTGVTPYKHHADQFGKRLSRDDYLKARDFIKAHFVVINPQDRTYKGLIEAYLGLYSKFRFDISIADPFTNVVKESTSHTYDIFLNSVFGGFKKMSLETNSYKDDDGVYKVCDQFMIAGGAAWNNNMDYICTPHRPFMHLNYHPSVEFYAHKIRRQQLVGKPGVVGNIAFNWKTNRYYFDGVCPIDGEVNPEVVKIPEGTQTDVGF